jgi:hypothetical protein
MPGVFVLRIVVLTDLMSSAVMIVMMCGLMLNASCCVEWLYVECHHYTEYFYAKCHCTM